DKPGLGGPRRQALVGAQTPRLVGRGGRRVDRPGRARLPQDQAARLPAGRGRQGRRGQPGGDAPCIMEVAGRGWLFAPSGLKDGPLPTHYEPRESPVGNAVYKQERNPARLEYDREGNRYHPTVDDPAADPYPYVFTTYRLTEHHTAGGMSRFQGYLSELQPEMFCEVSPALAAERRLVHGGWATIISARGAIEARVMVTDRMRPLTVQGRTVHQIGLPYHWGSRGLATGDAANDLLSLVLDPNVHIQEAKAATCDIQPGRRPRGAALRRLVAERRARAGIGEPTEGGPSWPWRTS